MTARTLGRRPALALAALLALSACALPRGRDAAPVDSIPPVPFVPSAADPRVELLWDAYGIPHIFADDASALFYAFGWAQMRSHAELVLRLYGQARGRAAEYWGEQFVDSDRWIRTNGVPARAAEWLDAQPAHMRAYLDAFAAGMNAWAEQHTDSVDATWRQVLPVGAADILATSSACSSTRSSPGPPCRRRRSGRSAAARRAPTRGRSRQRAPAAARPCCSPTRTCRGATCSPGTRHNSRHPASARTA
jgi:acyl-homoserine lactone acylase PvdQ